MSGYKIPVYQAMENSPYVQAPYLGTYFFLINTTISPEGNKVKTGAESRTNNDNKTAHREMKWVMDFTICLQEKNKLL